MDDEDVRSRAARESAERALVSVVSEYGGLPEFVVLGGLVPELLCNQSDYQHAGTTDVDVQVNLEIAGGAENAARLEKALIRAGFEPENERIWRWITETDQGRSLVKFELLADLDDAPEGDQVKFNDCEVLGAANLRGTGFAARDVGIRTLSAIINGAKTQVAVKVTGLAGFLLAKCAAARSRQKPKDWYDIAFVLLHNDRGGPEEAGELVSKLFAEDLGDFQTTLAELYANFSTPDAQGPNAYASQMKVDHPELHKDTLLADAVTAVDEFRTTLEASKNSD